MILDKINKNNENEPQKMCPQVVEFIEKMPIVFISDNQKVNIVNNINEVKDYKIQNDEPKKNLF
jgi:hypothetical protein